MTLITRTSDPCHPKVINAEIFCTRIQSILKTKQ
jgi:hypothetical protein